MSGEVVESDVVVVGGGLAGSSAASVLARHGLQVMVLERETKFRDRVRGEWLAPWGVVELDAMGLRHVADGVPGVNLITHHAGFDDALSVDEVERDELDIASICPGGGCLALGHPDFQEAMLTNAASLGAVVHRGVAEVTVTAGTSPSVTFDLQGQTTTIQCRLVVGADGRESRVRKRLDIELQSTTPQFMMAGMLVDGVQSWPAYRQSTGVHDDFHYLIFPQADGRVRVYGGWDVNDPHRFSGAGRQAKFLEAFRMSCLPEPDAIADGTPAGPLAGYPMTDTWTDVVARTGVVLVGDAAGWSDPVIGQGMAVALRDVHMMTDVLANGSDWSVAAFEPYTSERRERMRRLRFASAGGYVRNRLGSEARDHRRRLHEAFKVNPTLNSSATALLGAWVLPEETYSDDAWAALNAV